ncbi:MAG: ATP-dependent 6-phosphofructokinase [Verrucomicrobiae bacterium]|nr:ATP-dependent 6-phosphofructokinase [Verrucomicrobiae bacterium]
MRSLAVLTSGGDSPGMNPAIRSITRAALHIGLGVWGIKNGYQGLLDDEFIPLDALVVSGKNREGGTFLQTARCAAFLSEDKQREAVEILRRRKIDGLVVIGGDGSLHGALALHNLGFPTIGIPGTIDNDIYGTDAGIGVDTALNTIISLVDMIKATASSHRRCFVVEVMGRQCGYLALMTTISTGSQVAVIPEFPYNFPRIIDTLEKRFASKHNNSVIIVAEGVMSGAEFMRRLKEEALAIGKTVRQELRLTVLGHVQRGGSPTHFDRLLASRMGEMAVQALIKGESGKMTALLGNTIILQDLKSILGRPNPLPPDAIRVAQNLGIEIGDAPRP